MAEDVVRDKRGRFSKKSLPPEPAERNEYVEVDHNYVGGGHVCIEGSTGCSTCCPGLEKFLSSKKINTTSSWAEGRRLIEWSVLLDGLSFCQFCLLGPLCLSTATVKGEMKCGLGGFIYVQCTSCMQLNRVAYGSTHKTPSSKGMPSFSVNTKLGAAMIDALGGPQRVNNVLTTLNLPPISHKNLKVMERRAGDMIEDFANLSMEQRGREAFEAEKRDTVQPAEVVMLDHKAPEMETDVDFDDSYQPILNGEDGDIHGDQDNTNILIQTEQNNHNTESEEIGDAVSEEAGVQIENGEQSDFGMTVCADHGWQKRGFDSLTGHTFLMSKREYGNKIVKVVVKHRTCATCKWWKRNRPGRKPKPHRCVWNHRGSARMMESRAGLEAISEMMEQGTPVKTIEGDGDNTLVSRLKSELGLTVRKKLDRNHSIKNIVSRIYDIKKSKAANISGQVIRHLTKSLKYVFAKNQGDTEGLKENLIALVPHQFGDHSMCKPRFCGYKRKPGEKYHHRSLPYKAPLKDAVLRKKLEGIFEIVIAKAAVYSDLGSSQACEHANRAASLRAPKHLHYGESESLDYRVKATAACINEGRNYLSETFKKHGLSPGSHTVTYNLKKDLEREKRKQVSCLPETKLRRLKLKEERATSKGSFEASEGATYEAEISMGDRADDIDMIPEAIPKPLFSKVEVTDRSSFILVDLETTDLIRKNVIPHITQLAAMDHATGNQFSQYIIPKMPISAGAEDITGIVYDGGKLSVKGKTVPAVSISQAFSDFFAWMKRYHFENPVLVAHNGKNFDFRVLTKAAENCNMIEQYLQNCMACVDSIAVMKAKIPKLPRYSEAFLVNHLCKTDYNAHNAVDDVVMLHEILVKANVNSDDLLKNSYPPNAHILQDKFNQAKTSNLPSLHCLIAKGILKMNTAENIAGSGLNMRHLKLIWQRSGEDGLQDILTAKNSIGKPRVSSDKKLTAAIAQRLSEMFTEDQTL